ncbi:glycosyltransferase [Kibdelosporangium aridum]|uniref:glycosyltransferase n=1 Tax=Kibdelosporangium aridum TaxID=2030 RepID=UPI000526205E
MTAQLRGPILFAGAPYSGMTPMIVTAAEVVERGAEVWFAGTEKYRPEFDARTAGRGGQFISLGAGESPAEPSSWDEATYHSFTQRSKWRSARAFVSHNLDVDLQVEWYRKLDAEVQRIKPALLVVDCLAQYAIDVAITRGIPFVINACLMPSFVLQPLLPRGYPWPYSGLPLRMTWRQRVANSVFKARMKTVMFRPGVFGKAVKYAKYARQLGIDPKAMKPSARIDAAELILLHTVFGLEYPFDVPDKVIAVGSITPPLPEEPNEQELRGWLDTHDSVVYLAFGTIIRLTPEGVGAFIEAARRLPEHAVLWKLPKEQWEQRPAGTEIPPNLRVEHWVPSQFDVLAHPSVKVFFTHAGSNGMHECLNFGKPMLCRPGWIDCHDIAHRIVDAGMGLTLDEPYSIDTDDIVAKLTRVLTEPSFRERAEYWTRKQQEAGGVRRAADLIIERAG